MCLAAFARWLAVGCLLSCLLAPAAPAARASEPRALELSAWLPHWAKHDGAARFAQHVERFSAISPFAFRVQSADEVADTPRIERAPWPQLQALAKARGVKVLPSVVWADRDARARALADDGLRARHLAALLALVSRHGFDGLDLDYERKLPTERAPFSRFVRELAAQLHAQGKTLSCTLEPRTTAEPPPAATGRRASAWVDDYAVIGTSCDVIRIMAYDQWAIAAAGFEGTQHASASWVRAVLAHSAGALPRERLHLGIPTYGWELSDRGGRVEKRRALGFDGFQQMLRRLGLAPLRHDGQLVARRGGRVFVMSDATTIATLTALAREAGIAGVTLFKLDGKTDPAYWAP